MKIIKTNLHKMAKEATDGNEFAWKGFAEYAKVHPIIIMEQRLENIKNNKIGVLTQVELDYLKRRTYHENHHRNS